MFSDPFINTLFDTTHEDTNVSSDVHGLRLASWFLSYFGDYEDYYELRNVRDIMDMTGVAHIRAKGCPYRGNLKSKEFTYHQICTWLGYLHFSAIEQNFPEE